MINNLKIDYPEELIPQNVNVLIERLESIDNREVGRKARQESDKGEFSDGLINAVKKAIQTRNRLDQMTNKSAYDHRVERILTIKDSNNKKRSRK